MKIKLNTIKDVNDFVSICGKYHNCDITVKQNKYKVDGKSILGILSLNLLESIRVIIDSEKDDLKITFYNEIGKWS